MVGTWASKHAGVFLVYNATDKLHLCLFKEASYFEKYNQYKLFCL